MYSLNSPNHKIPNEQFYLVRVMLFVCLHVGSWLFFLFIKSAVILIWFNRISRPYEREQVQLYLTNKPGYAEEILHVY